MDVEKINSDYKKDYEVVNGIMSILEEFHQLNPAIHLFQKFVFVLDANFVLKDIRHSISNNRYTYLQFCLKNRVAAFYAPIFLKNEIVKNIHRMISNTQITKSAFINKWQKEYEPYIFFTKHNENYSSKGTEKLATRDLKDVPYLSTSEVIKADNILTEDKDFGKSDFISKTYPALIIINLAHYSTNSLKATEIYFSGTVIATISIKGIRIILNLIKKYPLLLVLGLGVFVFIKNHPQGKIYSENIKKFLKSIIPEEAIQEIMQILSTSDTHKNNIESSINSQPKYNSLKQHAYRVLIESGGSIKLKEMQKNVFARGYHRNAVYNDSYLRKVLKSDPNIELINNGEWTVSLKIIE